MQLEIDHRQPYLVLALAPVLLFVVAVRHAHILVCKSQPTATTEPDMMVVGSTYLHTPF